MKLNYQSVWFDLRELVVALFGFIYYQKPVRYLDQVLIKRRLCIYMFLSFNNISFLWRTCTLFQPIRQKHPNYLFRVHIPKLFQVHTILISLRLFISILIYLIHILKLINKYYLYGMILRLIWIMFKGYESRFIIYDLMYFLMYTIHVICNESGGFKGIN